MSPSRTSSSRRKATEKKDAEDVFVEKTLELTQWAKDNSQMLVLAGIVLVVAVAGGLYYLNYRSSWEEQAVARLTQVQGAVGLTDAETVKADLYQYLEQFEGTVYALEARLTLGQFLLEEDDPQEAIDILAPAVRKMESQPIGLQAASLMASAYEEAGQIEDAERLYLRIANETELNFQMYEALSGAARIRKSNGDMEGAAELYREVLSTLDEEAPERTFWEMRLAEVTSSP